ncbi:MAG: hypothetical protein Rubg2KO_15330 [Rubricoccaceae bacterium]
MAYDPDIDHAAENGWAIINGVGQIINVARSRTEAITAFVGNDLSPARRTSAWRWWRRKYGIRAVRVVTRTLTREALTHSALRRARAQLGAIYRQEKVSVADAERLLDDLDTLLD